MAADLTLHRSMALAAACLRGNAALLAAAAAADPLRLDLPPLPAGSRDAGINASTVRALAAVYLQANLEDTGILAVAELLGQSRDQLRLVDAAGAQKLEPFAHPPSDAYTRSQREAIFARVFGLGGAAEQSAANHEFEQLLAAMCAALQRCEEDVRFSGSVGAARDASLRYAASALLFNLAPRQYGNTLLAARAIDRQLRQAIAALSDRSVLAQFRVANLWQVIRAVAGDATPDLGRLLARGQSGMAVLTWLAGVLGALDNKAPIVARGDAVFLSAAQWLEATGLTTAGAPAAAERKAPLAS
jgi:hypothetical protein